MKRHTLMLLTLLLIASLMVAAFGAVLKYEVLKPLGIQREENIMELPFVLLADDSLSNLVAEEMDAFLNPPKIVPPLVQPEPTIPETEPNAEQLPGEEMPLPTEPAPEPTYEPVDESWFDDALFIGDSRTVGLQYVDCLGEAEYFCSVGMSVYSVLGTRCYSDGYGYNYLTTVLTENPYGKIFVHLGLNECGGDHERLMTKYRELVDLIVQKQPDAMVVLQEVMTVSKIKATDPKFSLERIEALNEQIRLLAEEYELHCINTNEWLSDEEGYLLEELNRDGAHLHGAGYLQWGDWLREKAAVLDHS